MIPLSLSLSPFLVLHHVEHARGVSRVGIIELPLSLVELAIDEVAPGLELAVERQQGVEGEVLVAVVLVPAGVEGVRPLVRLAPAVAFEDPQSAVAGGVPEARLPRRVAVADVAREQVQVVVRDVHGDGLIGQVPCPRRPELLHLRVLA